MEKFKNFEKKKRKKVSVSEKKISAPIPIPIPIVSTDTFGEYRISVGHYQELLS